MRSSVDAWLFAAGDPLGAAAGIRVLRDWGIDPLAISGVVSMSPLGMKEAQAATGLPCITGKELQSGGLNARLLKMVPGLAAGGSYRHNASHNAGILYHEYGHHINRHTADFRANALRPPHRQVNLKTAMDEGTCDYWAATMLGTPHIWAWHRRHDHQEVHPPWLTSSKTMADYDQSPVADADANGTIWAAADRKSTRLNSSH